MKTWKWRSLAPRRYQVIAWKILHQRIPTRDKLRAKGVVSQSGDISCVHCGEEESVYHLFFDCSLARKIWNAVYEWTNLWMVQHNQPARNFMQHCEIFGHGRKGKVASALWIAIVWSLWNYRNRVLFEGIKWKEDRIVEEIKARLWSWVSIKEKYLHQFSFSDWRKNIRNCIN